MEHLFDAIIGLVVGGYFVALGLGAKFVRPAALRGKKAFIILGALIMLGGVSIVVLEQQVPPPAPTPQQVAEGIRQMIPLPKQLDTTTRLDTVEADEGKIVYRFSITATDPDDFARQAATVRRRMEQIGCHYDNNRNLLQAGIGLEMIYTMLGRAEIEPVKIELTPKECGY
ncbi:MAG: hypothetical protein WDO70_08195 [Alphaproteobacteria bacterium]